MGIIERIGALTGSEAAKAVNLAHDTFQDRLSVHGHHGRALLETFVEVARSHPNLMGLAAGVLVEQLLVHEKHHHEEVLAAEAAGLRPPRHELARKPPAMRKATGPHVPHHTLRMAQIRPFRLAVEVFGALLLLKFSAGVARTFRRKNQREIWFAPAAKVRLISGSLAAYYGAKSVKSKRISAWRNAAVALFATDAIKPVLKPDRRYRGQPATPAAIPPPPPAAAHEALVEHHGDHHGDHDHHNGHDVHPGHEPAHQEARHADHGHNGHDRGHGQAALHADEPPPDEPRPAFRHAPEPQPQPHHHDDDVEPEPDAF